MAKTYRFCTIFDPNVHQTLRISCYASTVICLLTVADGLIVFAVHCSCALSLFMLSVLINDDDDRYVLVGRVANRLSNIGEYSAPFYACFDWADFPPAVVSMRMSRRMSSDGLIFSIFSNLFSVT